MFDSRGLLLAGLAGFDDESVMGQCHRFGEFAIGFGVPQGVGDVCEERPFGPDAGGHRDGFDEIEMRRVRFVAEGVEDEDVEILQALQGIVGYLVAVGTVCDVPESKTKDRQWPMHQRNRRNRNVGDAQRFVADFIECQRGLV